MITRLRVKNYALIEDLDITFGDGFSVLTGVTGAGKSILIGSMNLILGDKASLQMVRSGAKEAFVEATFEFDTPPPKPIGQFLPGEDHSGQEGNILLLKRQVAKGGRSSIYANDGQITLATLKEIGMVLADLLGQHHHQSLLNSNTHRRLLDRFSLDRRLLTNYRTAFSRLRGCQEALANTVGKHQISKERQELYRFQLHEIERAQLQPGEEALLQDERKVLKNAQKIVQMARQISHGLSADEDDAALNRLRVLLKEFESLAELDGSLKERLSQWKDAVFSLEDLAFDLSRYGDSIHADPERLEWVQERLRLWSDLVKKYGDRTVAGSVDEPDRFDAIIAYRDRIEGELKNIEGYETQIEELRAEVKSLNGDVDRLGLEMSKQRKAGAARLKEKLEHDLRELGMKGTKFKARFTPLEHAIETGLEEVEFLISPNPGEPLKPLAKIASGGEISRIMLAFKTVLAKVDNIPLLVFDEIDVGIGGDIASLVGKKLKNLSQHHQVICITHLQQIASYGHHHFRVSKIQKGGRTITEVTELSHDERVKEIARMIAGEEITDLSLQHATEFLAEAARG